VHLARAVVRDIDIATRSFRQRRRVTGEQKPQRVQPRIIAAPKIRQLYWCDFWQDAMLPEMWKTRPVIVVSYKNALYGPCLVVPTSTDPQTDNPWAHRLSVTFAN
jgi:mRNA interferase MazF